MHRSSFNDNLYFTKQTLVDKKLNKKKQQYRVRLRE